MLVLLFVFWQGKPALWRIPFWAFSLFPLNHVKGRLYDAIGGVNAAQRGKGVNGGVLTDNGAGVYHRAATDVRAVGKYAADLAKSRCVVLLTVNYYGLAVGAQIRADSSRARVRAVAKNRVADVIVVRYLHLVKQNAVFKLRGISDNAALARNYASTYERAGAHLTARAYYRRTFYGCRGIYLYVFTDENAVGNEGVALDALFDKIGDVLLQLWEHLPWVLGRLKEGGEIFGS